MDVYRITDQTSLIIVSTVSFLFDFAILPFKMWTMSNKYLSLHEFIIVCIISHFQLLSKYFEKNKYVKYKTDLLPQWALTIANNLEHNVHKYR